MKKNAENSESTKRAMNQICLLYTSFLIHDERTVVDRLGRIADFRDVEPGVFQKLGSIESGTLNTCLLYTSRCV